MALAVFFPWAVALLPLPNGNFCTLSHANQPNTPIYRLTMSMRKVESETQLDHLLKQAQTTNAVVALHFTQTQHQISNAIFRKAAQEFEMSQFKNGATCAFIIIDADEQPEVCRNRGVQIFPSTQLWCQGLQRPLDNVYELEKRMLALGARNRKGEGSIAQSGPSATAVDEIDFTGGAPLDKRVDRGTTRRFFPGLDENEGT